ncbi:flagellar biosynthetic protein FliO [Microbacterium thalli]|uniref:Flagellar biosynthetic protein FliO n=1 Tax=Microbacterium thalli TaxID=3027921 RepID=A0ABT5SD85_9MICO|nr:flagellar biosynthetic protein FliO [Microbacterium thalli]MDD7960759.1 flagellar biosynthetic protein FliO [Microbacterium thalli]
MLAIVWLLQRRLARGSGAGIGGRTRGRTPARRRADDDITVVAKRGIGPKAQVAVVEIGGARYVLGVTEAGVSMLDRVDPPPGTAPAAEPAAHPAPVLVPRQTDAADPAPLAPPLPLRRSVARAERASRPTTMTARDAAQVLRRALGA